MSEERDQINLRIYAEERAAIDEIKGKHPKANISVFLRQYLRILPQIIDEQYPVRVAKED